jgi:hypothetical protein
VLLLSVYAWAAECVNGSISATGNRARGEHVCAHGTECSLRKVSASRGSSSYTERSPAHTDRAERIERVDTRADETAEPEDSVMSYVEVAVFFW